MEAVQKLNVNRGGGRPSPHKPVLLLALLDLRLAGKLFENRIQLFPALMTRYKEFFDVVAQGRDTPNIHLPYFYMRSEPFWELHPASGHGGGFGPVGSLNDAREKIAYASLDEAVWEELKDPQFVEETAQVIMGHWFPEKLEAMRSAWARSKEVSRYEIALEDGAAEVAESTGLYVPARDAAFRRLVVEGYDYRCAASGWRFTLEGWSLVEAAHIVPFSESHDDRPENGIALTPSFHRLMDKRVIAPGPDLKWHVSSVVDRRIPDNQQLVELDGASLILPQNPKFHPDPASLERRQNQLL
ncbi:HNH endonuclease [Thiohalorhabdus denitrificans]|uniref:HNH endonuclease n=1 Tax=Thiohalorhabdus denitrificans TaxID=381306 RepID=UPI0015A29836|nr:HNH endonuclease [Thiohalorhabdus denitrificans]